MIVTRSLPVEIRAADDEDDEDDKDAKGRTFEFVASTETPVEMGFGREVLRMSGMDLSRFRANPVILNTHSRAGIEDIVGRAVKVWKRDSKLHVRIRTTTATEAGRTAAALLADGSLRAVSIGYRVDEVDEIPEGENRAGIAGPAYDVKRSQLMEISVVPVPADPAALKRAYAAAQEAPMQYPNSEAPASDTAEETRAAAPAPAPPPPPAEESRPTATQPTIEPPTRALDLDHADRIEARRRQIMGFCPGDLRPYAEGLLLEDPEITPEAARAALLEERARRLRPVGTPEPTEPTVSPSPTTQEQAPDASVPLRRLLGGR